MGPQTVPWDRYRTVQLMVISKVVRHTVDVCLWGLSCNADWKWVYTYTWNKLLALNAFGGKDFLQPVKINARLLNRIDVKNRLFNYCIPPSNWDDLFVYQGSEGTFRCCHLSGWISMGNCCRFHLPVGLVYYQKTTGWKNYNFANGKLKNIEIWPRGWRLTCLLEGLLCWQKCLGNGPSSLLISSHELTQEGHLGIGKNKTGFINSSLVLITMGLSSSCVCSELSIWFTKGGNVILRSETFHAAVDQSKGHERGMVQKFTLAIWTTGYFSLTLMSCAMNFIQALAQPGLKLGGAG